MSTEILTLDEIVASQSSKYVTHNTALRQIEGQAIRALDKDLTGPPGGESDGDVYIVGTGATGGWAGQDDNIAHYYSGSYKFYSPVEGMRLWLNDEDKLYVYYGGAWTDYQGALDHGSLSGLADDDHTQYLRADGTRALSANWDAGAYTITADALTVDSGASEGLMTVDVDAGVDASTKYVVGTSNWSSGYFGTEGSEYKLKFDASTRLAIASDGATTELTPAAATDANLKVKVDSGQDASISLEEGTDDWELYNDGGSGNLRFAYNDTDYYTFDDNNGRQFIQGNISSHAHNHIISTNTTTDATTTTLDSFAGMPNDTAFTFLVKVSAHEAATGDSKGWVITGAAKDISGTVSIIGTPSSDSWEDAGASAWTAEMDASGGDIRVRVTGEAAHTIVWKGVLEILY